jgi:S1-C subfamily serine protease
VVAGATGLQVSLYTGQTVPATLVGVFTPDDLAVVRVSGAKLQPATLADSKKLQVGEICLAIGNPLGLASSVTEGIVSFNGRTVSEGPGVVLPDTVQTSAAINPGNSGGALVDLAGRLIGIPTLAAGDPRLGGAAPGIGFAIPSNTVRLIADQLIANGKVTNTGRAALGISATTAYSSSGKALGVVVVGVSAGGPAEKAGIHAGELITAVDSTPTPTLADLQSALTELQAGASARVTLLDPDGARRNVTVVLEELPA